VETGGNRVLEQLQRDFKSIQTKIFHKHLNEEIRDKNRNAKLEIVVKIEAGARAEIRSLLK
jgi:hypothetical protein